MNKLWLIVKSLKLGDKQQNRFYVTGGEVFKLGRVVMKIHEVNLEQPENHGANEVVQNQSQERNTQMSFAEIDEGAEGLGEDGHIEELNLQIQQAALQEQAQQPGAIDLNQIQLLAQIDDGEIVNRPTYFERGADQEPENEADEERKEQPTVELFPVQLTNPAQIEATEENVGKIQQDDIVQEALPIEENQSQKSNAQVCRICFEEDLGSKNPLISPCNCSGSMKFVHLRCLQRWRSRTENKKRTAHVTTYTWKAFHCELCKCKLQDTFEVGGSQHRIFEVEKPASNFLVVETSQINANESESEKQKQLHIISFENTNKVRFGRGHETEVRIVDISVSRLHAIIHKDELGRLYLEDNGSKFGTLAQVLAPMHLNEHFEYSFQAGRSVFHVNMQQE